jgi:hypothetical protein
LYKQLYRLDGKNTTARPSHPFGVVPSGARRATVVVMALLSAAMRTAAFTDSSRPISAWVAGRQWGRWGDQWVQGPGAGPGPGAARRAPGPAGDATASLERLRAAGVVDDAEFAALRARIGRPA